VLNIYLSTQVLNITDLTCDASVALGGCSYGALVICGINPVIALLTATCLGAVAGLLTSSLVINIKVEPVLASIITLTAIETFIVKLSGFGHAIIISCGGKTVLSSHTAIENVVVAFIAVLILSILFYKILNSEYGLAMRVYGDGVVIARSLGINTNRILCVGLGMGNALSAAAGALITQILGTFNSGIGNGSMVFGLAAVIIGSKLVAPNTIKSSIIACFIGSFVYKAIIALATFGGSGTLGSEYNGVITAVVLVVMIALAQDGKKKRRII
jgi:putative ABC transport system permease protein